MNRYLLLLFCTLLACDTPQSQPERPNFVFFLVDDMGWTDLGCFRSKFYETPNIDRLAASGVRFTQAYAACPVCSPTRASIMSGKYPARLKVTDWIPGRQSYRPADPGQKMLPRPFRLELPLEETTIAEALQQAGYQTFFAGKWHLGETEEYWPEHQGFAFNKGGHSKGSPPGGYFSPYTNPRLESGPEGEYLTDRLGEESVSFLKSVGEQPFLLYLSFYTVHNPMQGKQELVEKYKAKQEEIGHEEEERFRYDAPWIATAPPKGNFRERLVQDHPTYASMVQSLDHNVGKVLDQLDSLGMADNTVVIFMSDNGGLSTAEGSPTTNFPLRAGKGWLYEGGIREPMIIRWPGQATAGTEEETPVTSTDFYPTMLEMAGLPLLPEQHVDGESLVPLLRRTSGLNREAIYWHYPHYANQGGLPGAVIRSGDYKLIEAFGEAGPELYNLQNDIGEQNNLAEQMPALRDSLLAQLHQWQKSVGAEGMDANPDYDPTYRRE
ncbi:MAG: sulfatase [Bacteroidota bacterium]